MGEKMQGSQTPVNPIEPEVLGEPVCQIVPPLLTWSTTSSTMKRSVMVARTTHSVKILDVVDIFLDTELLALGGLSSLPRA